MGTKKFDKKEAISLIAQGEMDEGENEVEE